MTDNFHFACRNESASEVEQRTASLISYSSERPLVLIVHASVGSGHRSAAFAISEAMKKLKGKHPHLPENTEIAVVDILDFGWIKFSGEKTASLFTGVMSPVYNLTWHYSLTGRFLWGGGFLWSTIMYDRFTELVEKRKPIAIIATHIVAANCAVAARMLTQQRFPISCVPTDYGVEGFWPHACTDLFCAADELMVEELLPRKVPLENIEVTGIPVREGFDDEHDRTAIRASFNLPQDKMLVLVMAGAKYSEPYLPFRKIIEPLFSSLSNFGDMHFVFITGEDAQYASYLRTTLNERGIKNVTITGYVDNMVELLSASDLIVAKSGGLAVTECVCARLPMILVGKPYGQERANTLTVTAEGAAITAETSKELVNTLTRVHQRPYLLQEMRDADEAIRKPNSAYNVAVQTLNRVGTVNKLKKHPILVYWGKKPLRIR